MHAGTTPGRLHCPAMKHPPRQLCLAAALLLAACSAVAQEQGFYRVEVVIFTHAGGESDAWADEAFESFADLVDPSRASWAREFEREAVSERPDDSEEREISDALEALETIATLERDEPALVETLLYPDPWIGQDALSGRMQPVLRKLADSGAYRVRSHLAWYQPLGRETAARAVRIHDDQPIAADWVTLSPMGGLSRQGRAVETVGDLAVQFHYRLDGFVRLRQRQFMHADIELHWRVPQSVGPAPMLTTPRQDDSRFEQHYLQESRTVRPGRFEYFDSDWLGLLLLVTEYATQAESETDDADDEATGETTEATRPET